MKTMTAVAVLILTLLGDKTHTVGQTAPPNMALIPAGSFTMGNSMATNEGDSYELPLHTVYVSAFSMDKYEVTKVLWDEVYQWAIAHGYSLEYGAQGKANNHPAHSMTWYDAVKWCNARSEKEGRTPAYYTDAGLSARYRIGQVAPYVNWSSGYRLPTEAEWEKAARGGASGYRFPWADTDNITHSRANYYSSLSDAYDTSPTRGVHPTFNDGVYPYTSPVGYFPPNGYGLYDMAGNVLEWCWDWYGGYSSGPQTDPRGPTSGSYGSYRVFRGGSWFYLARFCRSAYRYYSDPAYRGDDIGFRVVMPSTARDPIQVIETQPVQPTYSEPPKKELGKDSLVVVTHGWVPKENGQTAPPDPVWVDVMVKAIRDNLESRGLKNWQVEPYKWTEKAWMKLADVVLGTLLDNADAEGINLGNHLKSQGWKHIHLISHSGGAALIQTASLLIKENNVPTTIHTTFLDAYVGFSNNGRSKYGLASDWSDSYFSRDLLTDGFTEGPLDHTYNVDVTWLDSKTSPVTVSYSTLLGEVSQTCYKTVSSHSWPHEFYFKTITRALAETETKGFGFPLSKEGGNWDYALQHYPEGANTLEVLGNGELSCPQVPSSGSLFQIEPNSDLSKLDFSKLPDASVIINLQTHVIIHGIDFTLKTASPAWLVAVLPITNKVNFVSFETQFSSASGAEGLLSVYWETNVIGSVDERVALPGVRQYTFPIPETPTNGTRALGFRLDAFSAIQSSVTVTNVALGFIGIRDPFSLSFTDTSFNELPVLQLTGPSGFNYRVETSTNLVNWSTIAILVNTNGIVRFVDPDTKNATAKFYRAVAP